MANYTFSFLISKLISIQFQPYCQCFKEGLSNSVLVRAILGNEFHIKGLAHRFVTSFHLISICHIQPSHMANIFLLYLEVQ